MEHRQILGNGSEIVAPDAQFNLVYILLHIYKHLFVEGIGLRQLMDYYFVLRTSGAEDLNNVKVRKALKSLGLEKFVSAVMWVLAEVFGLPEECMISEPDRKEGEWLLGDIMRNGTWGMVEKIGLSLMITHGYVSERWWLPMCVCCGIIQAKRCGSHSSNCGTTHGANLWKGN